MYYVQYTFSIIYWYHYILLKKLNEEFVALLFTLILYSRLQDNIPLPP